MAIFKIVNIKSTRSKKYYIEQVKALVDRQTKALAIETEKVIKEKIKALTKRPGSTGLLAESFEVYRTLNGHGVGKISYLNTNVPYWRHQNYGSEAIGANWQHWVPTGQFSPGVPAPDSNSFRDGRWDTSQGSHGFFPGQPIPAMNYVEKTLAQILPNVNKIIKDIR